MPKTAARAPGFYDRVVMPRIVNVLCGMQAVTDARAEIVPLAEGRVLEIGLGSGMNLRHYDPAKVERVTGVDPAPEMLAGARRRARGLPFEVEILPARGEAPPVEDESVDTVVVTFSLCTIPEPLEALRRARRALRPKGRLLFIEHGLAPDASVRRWQRRIDPVWGALLGGCSLVREPIRLLEESGFKIESASARYEPGAPRFCGYGWQGVARPA